MLSCPIMGASTKRPPQVPPPSGAKQTGEAWRENLIRAKSLPLPPGSLTLPVQITAPVEQDRALLPRILSDEIAFRSELLSRVQTAEQALLTAIDKGLYSIDKASLPALANSLAKLVQVSERIVERTKGLEMPKQGEQVSGLYAKYAVLQQALRDRGLVGDDGRLRNKRQYAGAIEVDVHEGAGVPEPTGTGVLGQGASPTGVPPVGVTGEPSPLESSGASPGVPEDEPLQAVPDVDLPLGPPSELDGPRRNSGYRKNWRKKRWKA